MRSALISILRHEKEGKPFFRMDEIARIQEFLSSEDRSSNPLCCFQDSFGNKQSYDTKNDAGLHFYFTTYYKPIRQAANTTSLRTTLVELRSVQYFISHAQRFGTEKPLYSPGIVRGNPAIAATNESLMGEVAERYGRDPRDTPDLINLTRVQEIFDEAKDQFCKSGIPSAILKVVHSVEKHIDNIVCFDLGTFEADVCGPLVNNWGLRRCATHHLLAFTIRDFLSGRPGGPPQLVFQHSQYTDDTITVLKKQGCEVFRDNTTAFRHITENTLVIWTGMEGPMPVPVKQVIADFPFQATPLPLPGAMIWLEEEQTTLPKGMDPLEQFGQHLYGSRWNSLSVMDTPRTNQLHEGYDKHWLPSMPDHDPFHFIGKPLTVYTRKAAGS
ncbi:hypothetical protein F4801DRAFT_597355 [Xylaria longipes]|nr:hypothetical protein F4801DRAFT_597355 [Xylaria longipes]